jgi:ribonuclease HII
MPKAPPTKIIESSTALARQKKHRAMFKRLLNFDENHSLDPETHRKARHLIGTDEVGRGCLAGPVVAAAVILPGIKLGTRIAKSLVELNDSKKLTFAQREKLALILQSISTWAIGEASTEEINQINILHASLLAMRRAIEKIEFQVDLADLPVLVLIDGNKKVKDVLHEQRPIIDGDAKSASIAAASIIAKVHRDRFMMQLSKSFPSYNWHQNKGYGSKVHRDALKSDGMTEWHRRVFCEKFLVEQLTIELPDDTDEAFEDEGAFNMDEAFKELVS